MGDVTAPMKFQNVSYNSHNIFIKEENMCMNTFTIYVNKIQILSPEYDKLICFYAHSGYSVLWLAVDL